MIKKAFWLVLVFAAPCFAASSSLEQLENTAGGSIREASFAIPSAAVYPADTAVIADSPETEMDLKSWAFPLPALPAKTYAEAVKEFAAYRRAKSNGIKNEDNLPFFLGHGDKTRDTVIMIHGLTDSPWFMRALGEELFQKGYNVIALLLPGHGTRPEDLFHATKLQWQQEIDRGLNIAAGLGARVSLAGFSTGGALALDAQRRHPELKVENIFLFSPALAINEAERTKAFLGCQAPWITTHIIGLYSESNPESILENDPHRYNKMAINGICQLYYLTRDIKRERTKILERMSSGTRVFAVESESDTLVSPGAVTEFINSRRNPSDVYIWYPKADNIAHADVTRPETNPRFPELLRKLQMFTY
ncbi:MAG TPA: hypothetical protein DCL44_00785 [Elusimicrobia bacterium]|nr:hypothetical protein [Elusimicrobiota bacterium]